MNKKSDDKFLIMPESQWAKLLKNRGIIKYAVASDSHSYAKSVLIDKNLLVFDLMPADEFIEQARIEDDFDLKYPHGVYITGVTYRGQKYNVVRDPNKVMPTLNKVVGDYIARNARRVR